MRRLCDFVYLTTVQATMECDTFIEPLDPTHYARNAEYGTKVRVDIADAHRESYVWTSSQTFAEHGITYNIERFDRSA